MENCTKKISIKLTEINDKREKLAAENSTEDIIYDQQKKKVKFSGSSKKNEQNKNMSKIEYKDKKISNFKRKHEEEETNNDSPKKKSKENEEEEEEESNNKNDFIDKLLRGESKTGSTRTWIFF